MPNSAARGNEFGLCDSKILGTSRRTSGSHAGQHRRAIPLGVPLALVIHADQVERASLPAQLDIFLAEQLHAKFLKELRGLFLSPRIDFMVSVAAPDAQRRAQPRKFRDAIFERVRPAGQKIAGDDGQIAASVRWPCRRRGALARRACTSRYEYRSVE